MSDKDIFKGFGWMLLIMVLAGSCSEIGHLNYSINNVADEVRQLRKELERKP